ncbi:MAG: hypothetical protein GQ550_08210 [Gammaproteobacteria bacterium]|nr:hypothetical protein [Gammaproteobacteria bacterium]
MLISQSLTQLFASQQQQSCSAIASEVDESFANESRGDTVIDETIWSAFDILTDTGISSISQCDCCSANTLRMGANIINMMSR